MTILRYLAKKYYDSTIQAENIDDITILGTPWRGLFGLLSSSFFQLLLSTKMEIFKKNGEPPRLPSFVMDLLIVLLTNGCCLHIKNSFVLGIFKVSYPEFIEYNTC